MGQASTERRFACFGGSVTIDGTAHPVLVVMGVSGQRQVSAAKELVRRLGWDYVEGDDLHPAANRGEDVSRHPAHRRGSLALAGDGGGLDPGSDRRRPAGVVTCSALRRRYRDVLRTEVTVFVPCTAAASSLEERMAARKDHFMPLSLLESQLATLEPLQPDELGVVVDIGPPTEHRSSRSSTALAWRRMPRSNVGSVELEEK